MSRKLFGGYTLEQLQKMVIDSRASDKTIEQLCSENSSSAQIIGDLVARIHLLYGDVATSHQLRTRVPSTQAAAVSANLAKRNKGAPPGGWLYIEAHQVRMYRLDRNYLYLKLVDGLALARTWPPYVEYAGQLFIRGPQIPITIARDLPGDDALQIFGVREYNAIHDDLGRELALKGKGTKSFMELPHE